MVGLSVRSFLVAVLIFEEDVCSGHRFSELCFVFFIGVLLVVIEGETHGRHTVDAGLVLMDFADVGLLLGGGKGTYPPWSLGALLIVLSGILCLLDINCRKELTLMSSKLRVMKALKNLRSLIEFLVAGFLRLMKRSNIIHLSSPGCSWESLDATNKLLSHLKSTRGVS